MGTPEVKVGDKVLYVPDSCFQFQKDHRGEFLFEFVHLEDGPARGGVPSGLKGKVVANHKTLGQWQTKRPDGAIVTMGGHVIKPTRPLFHWEAVVREIFPDGTVALDIPHPRGCETFHCPSPGATTGLRYSTTDEPHTWHLKGA